MNIHVEYWSVVEPTEIYHYRNIECKDFKIVGNQLIVEGVMAESGSKEGVKYFPLIWVKEFWVS